MDRAKDFEIPVQEKERIVLVDRAHHYEQLRFYLQTVLERIKDSPQRPIQDIINEVIEGEYSFRSTIVDVAVENIAKFEKVKSQIEYFSKFRWYNRLIQTIVQSGFKSKYDLNVDSQFPEAPSYEITDVHFANITAYLFVTIWPEFREEILNVPWVIDDIALQQIQEWQTDLSQANDFIRNFREDLKGFTLEQVHDLRDFLVTIIKDSLLRSCLLPVMFSNPQRIEIVLNFLISLNANKIHYYQDIAVASKGSPLERTPKVFKQVSDLIQLLVDSYFQDPLQQILLTAEPGAICFAHGDGCNTPRHCSKKHNSVGDKRILQDMTTVLQQGDYNQEEYKIYFDSIGEPEMISVSLQILLTPRFLKSVKNATREQ